MGHVFHHRLPVFFAALITGFASYGLVPVTGLDRLIFSGVMRGFAAAPFAVAGKGTHASPWELTSLAKGSKADSCKVPMVVSLGDDPGGVFQSSPPSPVDVAVILKNLQRLGAKQMGLATVLAWDNPDPIALKSLEIVLSAFQMVLQAAPLSRGTTRQAMPSAFRRASLGPKAIEGDIAALPLINRLAVSGVIFGEGGALAGFTSLDEPESASNRLPMLARWEDEERVVLAFPLLAELVHADLPVDGMHVKLGEYIQLGPDAPRVSIDKAGRMLRPTVAVSSPPEILAEMLIDGEAGLLPATPGLIVLRDDQSSVPRATRNFSGSLAAVMTTIGAGSGLGQMPRCGRLSAGWEASLLLLVASLFTLMLGWPQLQRYLGLGILAAACVSAQWLAVGMAQIWLPGISLLASIVAGEIVRALAWPEPRGARPLAAMPEPAVPNSNVGPATIGIGRPLRSVTMRKE